MRLYNSTVSGNCYKVRLLLAHLGRDYEPIELDVIDRSNRAELLGDKNPDLRVPVLELDDGRHIAESNAILCYLAEETPYYSRDPFERARIHQWLFFEQNQHEPNIAVARFLISILGKEDDYKEMLEGKHKGGHRALRTMERHLATNHYLANGRYSVADIALYGYTHVANEGGFDLTGYPAINGWLARVRSQPSHILMQ